MKTNPADTKQFSDIVNRSDQDIDLARAALVLAKQEYPELDIERYMARINHMGREINILLKGSGDIRAALSEINNYLFTVNGFHGNSSDYYNPDNSFLNCVLDNKSGIPITLSILYMEVARCVGIPLLGVAFPGHFLLKIEGADNDILIDPFNGGKVLTTEDCKDLLTRIFDDDIEFDLELLEPASKTEILTRMLYNLKNIYLSRGDYPRALGAVENILVLNSDSTDELRDRGILYYQLECFSQALEDLETYLLHSPEDDEAQFIREYIPELKRLVQKIS